VEGSGEFNDAFRTGSARSTTSSHGRQVGQCQDVSQVHRPRRKSYRNGVCGRVHPGVGTYTSRNLRSYRALPATKVDGGHNRRQAILCNVSCTQQAASPSRFVPPRAASHQSQFRHPFSWFRWKSKHYSPAVRCNQRNRVRQAVAQRRRYTHN
jgi:hypothetical protein